MVVDPGKNFLGQRGFPTPNAPIETTACRSFRVPANDEWLGTLMGAVELLQSEYSWYSWGELTPAEAAAEWKAIIWQTYVDSFTSTCASDLQTPYWDDADDVDDSLPPDSETWYGAVTDPDAPPDELTFVEDAAIWAFTGFVAYAAGIGAAIFFHTIAPRFVLAFKAGDIGELIRVVIDSADYGVMDTTGRAGEVINMSIVPPPSEAGGHDIMLVKVT